ncbi:glycosyltransferase family 9 protein [Allosalinactinospora lopnorensis]|uniref:glycosyltransferase family 9 protein n=1 Tax=Allosalinactinospora lopnorensis TaxID=1352348 RepID=UPI0009E4AD3B|nr:glycosyltransferase family 9 protein [Allosalinactinospora lopnorensis]
MAVTPDAGRILVLRALGLGDLLTAVPALRALRARFPRHRIVLAAPRSLEGLVPLTGAVDALAPASGPQVPPWSGRAPELAVNLHGSGPESIEALLRLRPGRLWAHAHPDFPDLGGPVWQPEVHEVSRWCRLLEHHGVPAEASDIGLRAPPEPSPRPGAVIVHPGAAHPARRWPEARYARLARWLAERGHDIVVTGTSAERPAAERVARLAGVPRSAVLAGETGAAELAALVAGAALVVSGDTGIAHLATAYRIPSAVLFGPVSPATWGPPVDRPFHVSLWAGRTGDPFGSETDPGLLRITTTQVTAAVERLLVDHVEGDMRGPPRAGIAKTASRHLGHG